MVSTAMDARLRAMRPEDWSEVSDLIHVSTNAYYEAHGMARIFRGDPAETTRLFCEVYEALDPGCCVVAEHRGTCRLMGSCFYHPRPTHVSLGIMNVHPSYFGTGVARKLLAFVTDFADRAGRPLRLVSSALNLDSFSLYTRAGFVPRMAFQDVVLTVPGNGFPGAAPGRERVREATGDDVAAIVGLERSVSGISREKDWRSFIGNATGIWHVSVLRAADGELEGVLASIRHPGSNMIGPGVAATEPAARALLAAELEVNRGRTPVFLVPVGCAGLVQTVYAWGGRNCEIHFAQCRGAWQSPRGVVMPSFMPETG